MDKILLGVSYGIYEGNQYGRVHYYQPCESKTDNFKVGYEPKSKKCSYNLALSIAKDWGSYVLKPVRLYFGEYDRVESVDVLE